MMKFKKIAAAVLAAAVLAATPATVSLFVSFGVTANAEDALTEGDYQYSVNEDGESVTITDYTGRNDEVEIPANLGGKKVTAIGESTFEYRSIKSVTIPDGVTKIGRHAFYNCTSLTSVAIPDSVTTIGTYAFFYCPSLTEVNIPGGVTEISTGTFYLCSSLTDITIPDGVTTIGDSAFCTCTSLTRVTIPDSVMTIGNNAFESCVSLEEVTVGKNNANYSSDEGILFNRDKSELILYPAKKKDTSYVIPNSVTKIADDAFWYCTSLTSVTIPDSVTAIGARAFGACTSLENVTIPDSVTTIAGGTFMRCESLASITIPDSVTAIESAAFQGCTSLASITMHDSVTAIAIEAFEGCTSLETVNYIGTKESWEAIEIGFLNECFSNAEIVFTEKKPSTPTENDTSEPTTSEPTTSEPTTSDTSEPTTSGTSEPTSSNTSEPTSSDTSEPTSSDTSEPASSDTSEPTTSDTSEPATSDTSEPTSSDTSEPTTSDTSEPTTSDTSEPTSSDTSEPISSDTSEPATSDTSEPTDPDIYDEKYDITTDVEPSLDAAGIPDDERVKSVIINAANWINKGEINLDEVKVKVREIYDEEGLKRAEAALGKILDGNKYNLLDLTLLYNGEDYSNGYEGLIQVKFKIPNGHKDKTISCYRITEVDGKPVKELIPGTQTEDYYIIYLEHFSLYALVAGDDEPATSDTSEPAASEPTSSEPAESTVIPGGTDPAASDDNSGNNDNSGNGGSGSDQAPTGIALAVAPAVLAAGTVIAVSKKRK